LNNCTITNNYAILGAGLSAWSAVFNVNNSIISFNGGGASISDNEGSEFQFTYSDIFGNNEGDWIDSIAGQVGQNGNINLDPIFVDTTTCCYYLQSGSPCINTGDPASPPDPDGSRADMGAFYFNQNSISDDDIILPQAASLSQNYPNPFNPSTTIEYALNSASHVRLTVYDLLGRSLVTLIDDYQQSGVYAVNFEAGDLPGGVYLYLLETDGMTLNRRAILIK
jgi:hypothetical protein